ncbi:MAG TPA: c-type cytochrome [Terriglobales bacterium]
MKPTPESVAEGKKIYSYDCAQCHGAAGDGKTDVAKDPKIPDLTDPGLQ